MVILIKYINDARFHERQSQQYTFSRYRNLKNFVRFCYIYIYIYIYICANTFRLYVFNDDRLNMKHAVHWLSWTRSHWKGRCTPSAHTCYVPLFPLFCIQTAADLKARVTVRYCEDRLAVSGLRGDPREAVFVYGGALPSCFRNIPRLITVNAISSYFYSHVTVHRNTFLFNNQPDALIIKIFFCYKTLHVSGIFSAHHQEFSTVHSALVSFMQVWWPLPSRVRIPSWLCLEAVIKPAWKNLPVPNVQ